ncbi:MAG: alpha/beta fold hydrolase [Deltaproteobacteria bacterium]|nr:alpha/beta fold hydrolase [Deltaproteobacteria bacterium]
MSPPAVHLLALHGFTGAGDDFEALAALTPGIVWVTPDLPGHGSSVEVEPVAALLSRLTTTLLALPRPRALLGYSMGGRIALQLVAALEDTHPGALDAVILIGASPGLDDPAEAAARRAADEALATQAEAEGAAAFLARWRSTPILRSQAQIPEPWRGRMLARRAGCRAAGLAASLRVYGTGALPSLWERLPQLTTPTTLFAGALDPKFVQVHAQMAAKMPRAQALVFPGVGHTAHLEAPAAFAAALTQALAPILKTGGAP